jgi:hypothetical protein
MRTYVIGSARITLCRKAPATLNDGEIAVASNAELHAALLNAKRLLARWNALPDALTASSSGESWANLSVCGRIVTGIFRRRYGRGDHPPYLLRS